MQNILKIMDRDEKDTSYKSKGMTRMGVYVLKYVRQYVEQHEIPPTHKEIFNNLKTPGFGNSPSALSHAVNKLIASGKIEKRGATRNLWPVELSYGTNII